LLAAMRLRGKTFLALLAAAIALSASPARASAATAAPWLFVSDVHLNPLSKSTRPSRRGFDTNEALLRSALAEMKRVDPAPPVVVIPGDFLGHHFVDRYAKSTMEHVAQSFGAAFPKAQFVIALGNEDSACGDYAIAAEAPFLRDAAAAWGPLVNRHGEAPDFMKTFPRDGFYTAKLPVPGLRAVVLDDTFWSPFSRAGCGSTHAEGAAEELDDLDRALPPGSRSKAWVLLHIPPGVDAFSTVHLMHHLAVVPFLESDPRNRLLAILGDKRRQVVLAIAGHTHKFAFRLLDADSAEPIPVLLAPALSPILRNNPMFLTVDVGPDGTIREIEEHAFEHRVWRDLGGSRDLGLPAFAGPALAALRDRLAGSAELRAVFARLYDGGAPPEITEQNWRGYWCAIDAMTNTDYNRCEGQQGFGFLTERGLLAGVVIAIPLLLAAIVGATLLGRRL
jgi:hypothetical protein